MLWLAQKLWGEGCVLWDEVMIYKAFGKKVMIGKELHFIASFDL